MTGSSLLNKFSNRLRIDAVLVAHTGIHVGAGEDSLDPTAATGAIVKYGMGVDKEPEPYIPGSSLKGVLRAFLASVDKDYEHKDGLLDDYKKAEQRREKNLNSEELAKKIVADSSVTHRLFGSSLMAGKVKLSDATVIETVKTEFRKGNAIDRDTHTAVRGALFDTEYIPKGTKFAFRLDAENLTACEWEKLRELIDYFGNGGIRVGGRSRAGLGEVSLEEITYTFWERENDRGFPKARVRDEDYITEHIKKEEQHNVQETEK